MAGTVLGHDGGEIQKPSQSTYVVSSAPSSATNTAISSAGSVLLALAETRCVAPGGSKNDCPTLNVSTAPPANCERISPLAISAGTETPCPCARVTPPRA